MYVCGWMDKSRGTRRGRCLLYVYSFTHVQYCYDLDAGFISLFILMAFLTRR